MSVFKYVKPVILAFMISMVPCYFGMFVHGEDSAWPLVEMLAVFVLCLAYYLPRRVRVIESPEATSRFPHRQAELTITLKDGTVLEDMTREANDCADSEVIIAKFKAAAGMLDEAARDWIVDWALHVEEQPGVGELLEKLA